MMQWRPPITALAGLCLLAGCQQRQEPQAEPSTAPTEAAPAAPALPLVEPPLTRETLLLEMTRIASDTALGSLDDAGQRALDGKRFELRLRFGCPGANDDAKARSWAFDEKRRKLTVKVEPEISAESPLVSALGEDAYEAAEGFWIRRPWLLKTGCPASPPAPAEDAAEAPKAPKTAKPASPAEAEPALPAPLPYFGIAQFFTDTDPRTHRRDNRAYTATKVLPAEAMPSAVGYDLVIIGRLRRLASGAVIRCVNRSPDLPPECIVSVQLDSVAIEQPGSGETIAKWSSA